jgi:DNA primase
MQIRLLSRFAKRVIVNFDPDTAGIAATEKSIALLTEEDFEVKIVTLDGGLDPDRFIREQGIQQYMAALRNAKRHSDYLIDRAIELFPARTADAKVKAMNYLLPHIRRMPTGQLREEFAVDAAQKLAISTIDKKEFKDAAVKRLESIRSQITRPLGNAERILLHALVQSADHIAKKYAMEQLETNPSLYDGLRSASLLEAFSHSAVISNPLDVAPDDESRRLLAEILNQAEPTYNRTLIEVVREALGTLEVESIERRQREIRRLITEADRRGDQEMLRKLTAEKLQIDRKLREH